ncbi:TPA: transcriptional regulator, partial [Pseudomonas aeruginosa]|nr:transcriptional regulator [Pseudomonas aeruginosa]HCF9244600.1 transcriptional regulator [Pseudomonas aeruginosa]
MRASIVLCVFSLALPASSPGWASGGRYLTWVDDNGGVHNTFVDGQFDRQQRQARQRIGQSDQARVLNKADNATQWPGNSSGGESKRRYYTWIDANGNVQNSFYAGAQVAGQRADYVLPNGEHSAEYIDAEAFEGKG